LFIGSAFYGIAWMTLSSRQAFSHLIAVANASRDSASGSSPDRGAHPLAHQLGYRNVKEQFVESTIKIPRSQ
jgi:hypothetical protein